MLKGYKRAKIVGADLKVLKSVFYFFEKCDEVNKTSFSKELNYAFIDENVYTMEEIANMTGNSICTIRRHIRKFNDYIENEKISNTRY